MENQKKEQTKVADQLVEMLVNSGVKNIYGITGDSLNEITDAICRDGRIKFIHMRHEESAAFAASAEAQLTGNLACCAGSSGPGHIHLINGLYDAQRSNAPVIAIASTCPSSMYGLGYFQETNPTLLFSNCNVYNQTAVTPQQFPVMFHNAMQAAISKGGVGIVAVPEDLNGQPAFASPVATGALVTPRLPEPSDEEIKQCAEIFNNAGKIAIYAGCGTKNAVDGLREIAAKLKAPVATTFKSSMYLIGDMPNYVGHLGYLGMWSAQKAINEADVILTIGENFPFVGEFPTDKKIVSVDIRAERLGSRMNTTLGIRSDAKIFFDKLLPFLNEKTDTTFLQEALDNFAKIETEMQKPVEQKGFNGSIRPEYLFSLIDKYAAKDAVFTVDTGMNCVWSSHYLKPSAGRAMIGSFTHGSMANAMPMAIGAAVTNPDRQVISLSGDGGLAMLMGDMLTIIQYNLPVKIMVADNRSLAYVRWEMELAGIKPWETDLKNPDFAEMAQTMGFWAKTVTEPDKLEDTVKEWLTTEGPALLSVVTETEAASFTFSEDMMKSASATNPKCNFAAPGSI